MGVIAIVMDMWSDRLASTCNLCIVSTVLCALELWSRSLAIVSDLVCVPMTSRPNVTLQSPLLNTPSCDKLEIRERVTRTPHCLQNRNIAPVKAMAFLPFSRECFSNCAKSTVFLMYYNWTC